jgi:hypothetical protein
MRLDLFSLTPVHVNNLAVRYAFRRLRHISVARRA